MTSLPARIPTRESRSASSFCTKLTTSCIPGYFPFVENAPNDRQKDRPKPLTGGNIARHTRLDPRVRELERQLAHCTKRIAQLQVTVSEKTSVATELNKRLKRTRQLKCAAEESLLTLKTHQNAARRTMVLQVRDHEKYAAQCLMLYERALAIIQQLIKVEHAGRKFVKHACPDCGPKPIDEFGVRVLPSGHIGFAPYCMTCMVRRKSRTREVQEMDIKETAKEFVERAPKVAREIADRFDEEVEEMVEEMRKE